MNTDQLLTELLHTLHLRSLAASDEAHKNLGAHAERLEAQLRAELARMKPLAEAAVALNRSQNSGRANGDLFHAALAYARAQAQDGAA